MHLFKQFRAAGGSKAQQDKLIRDFQSINKKVVEVTKSTGASLRVPMRCPVLPLWRVHDRPSDGLLLPLEMLTRECAGVAFLQRRWWGRTRSRPGPGRAAGVSTAAPSTTVLRRRCWVRT